MNRIKELWNKLKYWQKGATIGLIFAVVVQIYEYVIYKGYSGIFAIVNGVPYIISMFIDKSVHFAEPATFSFTPIIIITIWNIFIGSILGKIYGYFKIKYNKSTKFNIFILILLIFLYMVIVVVVFFYIYVFILIPET